MKQLKIAVLMGGPSAEREVSLRSGTAVANALAATGARVVPMDIRDATFTIPADVDVAFLTLHGTFGEDGSLQRILDEKGVTYTGSGPEASARAFDKIAAKQAFLADGIPTPAYEAFDADKPPRTRVARLGLPVVIKPTRQGSSVGISIVETPEELPAAYEAARQYDNRLMAEQFVSGRELTVGVMDGRALPVVEIRPKRGFYNYKAKYTKGETDYLVPATLDKKIEFQVKTLAQRAHDCLGCRDYSRVDFMLSEAGELFVLEVNTIPGFTETSLLPKAARAAGMEFPDLCARLVQLALARNNHNGSRASGEGKTVSVSR
ncbi:MAG TPA: D-alanine--D-alanine ligase [Verrucomicrobiae bacterium]|nr:D-alanine--D-alanine ligase [Verrucomicrobiae bacterium]